MKKLLLSLLSALLFTAAAAQVTAPGGVTYVTPGIQVYAKSAIPFIISPTGTMANNGAATIGTALPAVYSNAFIFLPAGAVAAGVPVAGTWFFTQCVSTTACTIFNNVYTSGIPTIPAPLIAFATTGPGAYTGVTTATIGPNFVLPGGSLGINGLLRSYMLSNELNNADVKTLQMQIGGTAYVNANLASIGSANTMSMLWNQYSQAVQVTTVSASNIGLGTAGSNLNHGTVNFANSQTWQVTLTNSTATDYFILEAFEVEVLQ